MLQCLADYLLNAALWRRYKLTEDKLPRIQENDPIARYFGMREGQVNETIHAGGGSELGYLFVLGGNMYGTRPCPRGGVSGTARCMLAGGQDCATQRNCRSLCNLPTGARHFEIVPVLNACNGT